MSINKIGLDLKSKTLSVTMRVLNTEPIIRLGNQINWEEVYFISEADLKKTKKGFWWLGRSLVVRVHFAAYFLQVLNKWTDRQTEEQIASTPKYQVFCGNGIIPNWKVPDYTKIEEFRNRFSVETHKLLGDYLLKLASQMGFADPSWMDVDSTVQEANMAYPADCNILKKLALKTAKVVEFLKKKGVSGFKNLELDIKGICKKAQGYFFLAKNKSKEIKRKIFEDYFSKVKHELKESIQKIESLSSEIKDKLPWNIKADVNTIQEKAWRYLLDVAHFTRTHQLKAGKILCLHLSAVVCIRKGKVDKENQFGRQIQLGRVGGNFMIPLSIEIKMEDKQSLVPMVDNHKQIFGQGCLEGIGTDKGYFTHDNTTIIGINTDGVQRPSNVKTGPPEEVVQPLRDRRAGIEPLIGHLKSFGLGKSKMKSDASTHASVYRCTMGFNLHQLLRHMNGKAKVA